MSQAPPPYGAPSDQPPLPQRPRPSAWWFGLGIALVLAAILAGVGLFIWTLTSFLDTDARVAADGRPHPLTVGTDEDRVLWFEDGHAQECRVVDRRTGERIALGPLAGSFDRSDSGGAWHGGARFDPGSGELEVTCRGAGTVLIGPAPAIGDFIGAIFATVLVPLVLGLAGLVVLLVTGILWSVRPARPRTGG